MPYRAEHAARIASPGAFKIVRSKRISKCIRLIVGKRCGKCPMETQAVRFDRRCFTPAQARAWLRKHGFKAIRFEKAI